MDAEEFEEKVRQELKKLDVKQAASFAWRCAVRALPFLGGEGDFTIWSQ
ncbi:MAG: hypothetical protein HRT35_24100 [Algicola sp.]|nr:hypothetical protein [Algicola sp.]